MMVKAANLGFPRVGAHRELKKAVEAYWRGDGDAAALQQTARALRARHWRLQADAGITIVPSNDFSLYDHVLDATVTFGAVPARFAGAGASALDRKFAMARGTGDVPAMEMTKWFDTNYHYIVPELDADQQFALADEAPLDAWREAKALGIETRPVLVGPVTFLSLAKAKDGSAPIALIDRLLPVYRALLAKLAAAGVAAVQIDEPILATDLSAAQRDAFAHAYRALAAENRAITVAAYFGALGDNLPLALGLPVQGLHLDLVRGADDLEPALAGAPDGLTLSLGLVEGRNIWRTDLTRALAQVERAVARLDADRVVVAPSCSLLHCPVDLAHETDLDAELKSWLAFATQKLDEVAALAQAAGQGRAAAAAAFDASDAAAAARTGSPRVHRDAVQARLAAVDAGMSRRSTPFAARRKAQAQAFELPPLPTTTIGSFPQTADVRKARAAHRRGELGDAEYQAFLERKTDDCIRRQEDIGIDVLVHGEFERNDMVEYFGEQLDGFAFTRNGWVQSYGSRCVKPPVIFGDVARPQPMTVRWSAYAQSRTEKLMKGMLTGPVTILQWSFVRDDQPRADTCRQIALAIRDEVVDLEAAGIRLIQIDEPALREGLPLRHRAWQAYLDWATECFRLSASGVRDETQIHTHMCYSEFNDIIASIAALDADVISIETSRSDMELLDAFTRFNYPAEIGPGVYDIHSPRVPDQAEMGALIDKALQVLKPEQLWINPDCGLKTRDWPEVEAALRRMTAAAQEARARLPQRVAAE
ncbi:MAG: 5-methyltetrahydropteroyltriglutamate--homocysteine S-methyltransferase [Alphaproteobacteria bacterium]